MLGIKKIGLIIGASALLIGGDLWYERSNGEENRIQPQDVYELMNGLQERLLASQYSDVDGDGVTINNDVYSIVEDGKDTEYFFFNGTNKEYYSNPKAVFTGVYTNQFGLGWWLNDIDSYMYRPYAIEKILSSNNYSNKWLMGVYETLTIDGFPTSYGNANFNGVYKLSQIDASNINIVYTNNDKTMQMENGVTYFYNGVDFWTQDEVYQKSYTPWIDTPVKDIGYYLYDDFHITCSKGLLSTNYSNIDMPLVTNIFVYDWVIANRIPSWRELFQVIDSYLFGHYLVDGSQAFGFFNGTIAQKPLLYLPIIYPDCVQWIEELYGSTHINGGGYIDPSNFGVENFTKQEWIDMRLHPETWLSNQKTMPDGTIVSLHDDDIFDNWEHYGDYVAPTSTATRLTKRMFDQRRETLSKLSVMVMKYYNPIGAERSPTWKRAWDDNVFRMIGYSNTYANAQIEAQNHITYATEDGSPYAYSISQKLGANLYKFEFKARDSVLTSVINSNRQSEINAYVKVTTNQTGNGVRYYDDSGNTFLIVDRYAKFNSAGADNRTNYVSAPIAWQSIPVPPVNPNGSVNSMGYQVDDELLMVKWTFQYCIN